MLQFRKIYKDKFKIKKILKYEVEKKRKDEHKKREMKKKKEKKG
jgi:hypothetical protein